MCHVPAPSLSLPFHSVVCLPSEDLPRAVVELRYDVARFGCESSLRCRRIKEGVGLLVFPLLYGSYARQLEYVVYVNAAEFYGLFYSHCLVCFGFIFLVRTHLIIRCIRLPNPFRSARRRASLSFSVLPLPSAAEDGETSSKGFAR